MRLSSAAQVFAKEAANNVARVLITYSQQHVFYTSLLCAFQIANILSRVQDVHVPLRYRI